MVKSAARVLLATKRKLLSEEFVDYNSAIILDKVLKSEQFKKSKYIAMYYSIGKEVKTHYFIKECFKQNKIVLLPKVINDFDMVFEKINENTEFVASLGFSFLKEALSAEPFDESKIEWFIVPGIAADEAGNRIGKGFGLFDRYFSKHDYSDKPITMLLFDDFIVESVNIDDSDVPVNNLITERRIINCKRT